MAARIYWRSREFNTKEVCELERFDNQWILRGTVTPAEPEESARWEYRIICDTNWLTQGVRIESAQTGVFRLRRDNAGRWFHDRCHVPHLDGAHDIDLGFTPATNTLPIRRQAPGINETIQCEAAWFRPDDGRIVRVQQHYTRTSEYGYEYYNPASDFRAALSVNEHGLVQHYSTLWFAL